jgi:hypothetical protein
MNMVDFIATVLNALNVPVQWLIRPTAYPGITYSIYSRPEAFGDGKQIGTGHYVQVDVWSKSDYSSLVEQVKTVMAAAGFSWLDESDDVEEDVNVYHKIIKYHYLEKKEG